MKIPIPVRLDMKSRPFRGLTVKQAMILAIAIFLAMGIIMAGGGSFWVRVALAAPFIIIALPFVFLRPGGRDFDRYLYDQITHLFLRPRERHWRRGPLPEEEEIVPLPTPVPEEAEVVEAKEVAVSPLMVLLEIFLICSLAWLTFYFATGGGQDLARWLAWMGGR